MKTPPSRPSSLLLASVIASAWLGLGADAPKPIEVKVPARTRPVGFAAEVAEFLDAKCVGCHGAALAENRLDMETVAGMLRGGKRGPAIVPGKADASLLFTMAAHRVEPVMPPKGKKDLPTLTPEELGLLKLWIDAGAVDDSATAAPARPIEVGTLPPGVHPINAVDLTADGRRVAAGRANVVSVFDVDSGLEIVALGGHKDLIQSLRYAPGGRRLAAGSFQVVTIWDAPAGGLVRTIAASPDAIRAFAASLDGKTIATAGSEKSIKLWSADDGKALRSLAVPAGVVSLAFAPDGSRIAWAGTDGSAGVVETAGGKPSLALSGPAARVAFLPDGRSVLTGSPDGVVRLWTLAAKPGEVPTNRVVLSGPKRTIRTLAVTPDGRSFLVGDDSVVRLHAIDDGKEFRSFAGAGGPPSSIAVSPDGKAIAVGSADGTARLHDLATGRAVRSFGSHRGGVTDLAFAPGGGRLLTAGAADGVKVWETATGRGLIAFGHPATKPGGSPPAIVGARFLADDRLVSAGADGSARVWSFEGTWGDAVRLVPHASRVLALDFSPDGTVVATGGGDPSRSGEVKLWDAKTGKLRLTLDALHSDTVFALRFSPDGTKLATAAADKFLKVIRVADGKELKSFEGHTHHVLAVDWKSDGKRLVTGGADNAAKVWDFETGEQLRTMTQAGKQVTGLRWLPAKDLVVASSGDATVRVWNPETGSVARTFDASGDFLLAVAASADGARVAAGGADGVLRVWDGVTGQAVRTIAP